ncbi:MAG: hypothetical protein LBB88_06620 [Planctomycetaceae bacterium]|jgi:endogenous inhibitor of DNA gyrase (YacG/DUF329 family)|nr:hypothetical protein [Planctomycetaceae bacterium]
MSISTSTIYRSSVNNSYVGTCTTCGSSRQVQAASSQTYGRATNSSVQQARSQTQSSSTYSRTSTCPSCGKTIQSGYSCPTCNNSSSRTNNWNNASTSYYNSSVATSCPTCGKTGSQNNYGSSRNNTNWAK